MLETNNIFLDTSTIVGHNFDYGSPALKRLEELVAAGQARALTTTVTVSEVESNIREHVQNARTAFERLRDKHPIVKNVPNTDFDAAKAEALLIQQFHDYLGRTKTEMLSPPGSSIDVVFKKYFEQAPPFSDKKKSEFPDAFVVETLERWSAEHGEKIYVIATDPDLTAACANSKGLLPLQRPSEFVDKVLRQDAHMRFIEESATQRTGAIAEAVEAKFSNLGFYLDDEDGDVNAVTVETVEIEELSLLEAGADSATFEARVNVQFSVEVSYDDMDTAVWDSEDGVAIPLHTVCTTLDREENVDVTVSIELNSDGSFRSVGDVRFPYTDVGITVRDHPYDE